MTVQDKVLSKTLKIVGGKLLRNVDDISSIKKLINLLSKKGYIGTHVINTTIHSEDEKLVEHEILNYIIHSGEYTESMAYDVNELSLNMAIDMCSKGVFAYDLLPHNFTFHNGKWFLYDFDSFKFSPTKSITQIRGFFKIIFSNYEILRLISREELKHYYLTRYRIEDIFHIIPLSRWLYLFFNQSVCNILYAIGFHKLTYLYLRKLFRKYSKKHIKNYYLYSENQEFSNLNKILSKFDIKNAFCIGKEAGNWAIYNEQSISNIQKLVYIDDYKLCDEYYNYIVKNEFKNIIPAVLYPLVNDDEIPQEYKYRALYDSYTQERFYSDCVIALDIDINEDLLKNLSVFTSNILVIENRNYNIDIIGYLNSIFNKVEINEKYIIGTEKKSQTIPTANKPYKDGNRGPDARRQSRMVKALIKSQL
ncbi:MAG: hypothetical protein IJY61_06650 [Candidatus Gastranaerophilales bacterium]|nr:hypothetical protein [Candidatus Gastranaerophilales bacterium]